MTLVGALGIGWASSVALARACFEGFSCIVGPWWRIGWAFRALEEGVQWLQDSGTTWYEPVVKVH